MEQGRSTSLRLSSQSNKLIPRDISESLGKLPPQALDMEDVVLGALMLEVRSIEKVPYLKPEHFYSNANQEVFTAIQQVVAAGVKPDFRSVINQLRKNGKLEIVGGAYYVTELTTKVSSAENIDHHSRIIVEMAIKRNLIQLASQVHYDSYEDTTDVFGLLKKYQEELKFLEERETASSGPERIKALWEKLQIKAKPERPESLIKIGEADVCTVGNISLLVGKKKSRKTLLVTWLLFQFLKSREHLADEVVLFDTEQEEYDVWVVRDVIYRMTNQYISVFCLRGLSPEERRNFIEQTVIHWPSKLKIAIIDGIRDCMSNINDPDESTTVMSWLMRLNVDYRIHFMCILHLNKTDNNARGHIGTELLNKAEITIEVELDPHSKDLHPPSVVKCESSRRKPFEPFMFTHSATGLPELLGVVIGAEHNNDAEQLQKLERIFEGEALRYSELLAEIKAHFALGDTKAKQFIPKLVSKGWLIKSGNSRSPGTTYKLVAHAVKPSTPVDIPPPAQQMMDFTAPEYEPPSAEHEPPDLEL